MTAECTAQIDIGFARTGKSHSRAMTARVLIVDDNEALLENLSDIFEAAGHDVRTAAHPADALKVAASFPFDTALVDYRLPESDGVALQRELARLRPMASYLLMTGHADARVQKAAEAGGFRAVFHKPVQIERVLGMLG